MSDISDWNPAFPWAVNETDHATGMTKTISFQGVSKREYFACLAMQALVSIGWGVDSLLEERATFAIANADALIAELSKESSDG